MTTAIFDYSHLTAQAADDPNNPKFHIGYTFYTDFLGGNSVFFSGYSRALIADLSQTGTADFQFHRPSYQYTDFNPTYDQDGNLIALNPYTATHPDDLVPGQYGGVNRYGQPPTGPYAPAGSILYSSDHEIAFHLHEPPAIPQARTFFKSVYNVQWGPQTTDQNGYLLPPTTIVNDDGYSSDAASLDYALVEWEDALEVTSVDLLVHKVDPDTNVDSVVGTVTVSFADGYANVGEILHYGDPSYFYPITNTIKDSIIIGTNFNDQISGDGKFVGSGGNDTLIGGSTADIFDLRQVPTHVEQTIYGNSKPLSDHSADDVLMLPGAANEYSILVNFFPIVGSEQLIAADPIATETYFVRGTNQAGDVVGQSFTAHTTQVVKFADQVHNPVELYAGQVASEMLQLSAEVYAVDQNGHARGFHTEDPLAYWKKGNGFPFYPEDPFPNPVDEAQGPASRGWHPVQAMELGLSPADFRGQGLLDPTTGQAANPHLLWSFVDGYYQATDDVDDPLLESLTGQSDRAEDDAFVLSGVVDNKRTIAITFAGTDQLADMTGSFLDFAEHYTRVKQLVLAVKAYADDPTNGIQQILVSGHSLGAGIAQYAMNDLPDTLSYQVHAYTAGSPGSDVPGQTADSRVFNLVHYGDPVTLVPYVANTAVRIAVGALLYVSSQTAIGELANALADAAIAANGGSADLAATLANIIINAHNKTRVGTDINIDTPFGGNGSVNLQKHAVDHYVSDLVTLEDMANESGNLFTGSPLAAALRSDIPYIGPSLNISLGTSPDPILDPNGGNDKLFAGKDTDFALGGGGDDLITAYGTTQGALDRQIDGGSGVNTLVLPGLSFSDIAKTQNGDVTSLSAGSPIATMHNIQVLVFPNDRGGPYWTTVGPFTPSVQTPAPGQTQVTFDSSSAVLDARGSSAKQIDASTSSHYALIFIDSSGAEIFGSNHGDIVAAGGNSSQTHSVAQGLDPSATAAGDNVGVVVHGGSGDDQLFGGPDADTLNGGAGDDLINGGGGANALMGGAGSDTFAFDGHALTDAQSGLLSHVLDFDQGNAGLFSTDEEDKVDASAIVSAAFESGIAASALVRAVADPSNADVAVQVDPDGTNGQWATLGLLDHVQASHGISALLDPSSTGSVQISVFSDDGHFGDFDGDHKADLLWRNDNGVVATWRMNGGSVSQGNFLIGVSSDWHIQGTGDFNGDGRSDILWLNDNGLLIDWQSADSAQTAALGTQAAGTHLAGIGDFDHDGKSDLIWRDTTDGSVTINLTGGGGNTISGTGNDWQVVGVGDYNGDGNADIMFRHASQGVNAAWLMNGTTLSSAVFYPGVPNDWHVEGTGDFDGDGTADLFWHNDNGANAVWLMKTDGSILQAGFFDGVGSEWHVVGTGDVDGDHKDDVVWRNDAGATAVWIMNGTQTPNVSFPGGVPNDWSTQAHHYEYV